MTVGRTVGEPDLRCLTVIARAIVIFLSPANASPRRTQGQFEKLDYPRLRRRIQALEPRAGLLAIRIVRRPTIATQSGLSFYVEGARLWPPATGLSASELTSGRSPVPPIRLANAVRG